MRAVTTPTPSPLSSIVAGAARATQDAMLGTHEQGLVGAGLLTVKPGAPALVKTQVKQFLNGGPADPQIGQRPMGIPLVQFETEWQNGRIGQWVRAYRPDLLG